MNGEVQTRTAATPPFPETLWTLVLEASQPHTDVRQKALGELAERYRDAVCLWFNSFGLQPEEAEDLTHDFLLELIEGRVLNAFERRQHRFRSYLATCLRNYLRDYVRLQSAQKRGGGQTPLAVDGELPAPFDDGHWTRLDEVFALQAHRRAQAAVLADCARRGQQTRHDLLRPFLFDAPASGAYETTAQALGISIGAVKKAVFDLREAYYDALRSEVAQTTDAQEVEAELRYVVTLLGRLC